MASLGGVHGGSVHLLTQAHDAHSGGTTACQYSWQCQGNMGSA